MKAILNILLTNQKTGEMSIREVGLPVERGLRNPNVPQFICELPPGHEARVLGVSYKEDHET